MKKKLAMVSTVFAPTTGGMATVAVAEANALAELYELTVFTLRAPRRVDREKFPIHRLLAFPKISLSGFAPQLVWRLRQFSCVYAHLPAYGFLLPLIIWKLLFRGRLVVTLHMDPIGRGWRKIGFIPERFILRALLRLTDSVRVSTEQLAHTPLLQNISPVHVIPFGVNPIFSSAAEKDWSGEINFLFVGRLARTHYFKGVPQLLRAFSEIISDGQRRALRIVGDGDLRSDFENLAHKLDVEKNVIFMGALSDEQLAAEYIRAHVLVLPSTDTSETFGLVLMEALASGTPVIASDLPGVRSIFERIDVGKLVPPGDVNILKDTLQSVCVDRIWWKTAATHAPAVARAAGSWEHVALRLKILLY